MSDQGNVALREGATPATAPRVSVVLATYNRGPSLVRLLRQLAVQTLPPDQLEVVVVDDGSRPPAREALAGLELPYRFKLVEQPNGGAGVARHRGVLEASGEILVITDDDMQVPPEFLAAHLAVHEPGTRRVVMGRMRPSEAPDLPLFERFHMAAFKAPGKERPRPRGNALCTGNVSMRRADYLAVGGFDLAFKVSEDMELGVRLEASGAEILASEEAYTIHETDHRDFMRWRRRMFRYGAQEVIMARKHPGLWYADPWRLFFANAAAKRPFVSAAILSATLGRLLCFLVHRAAVTADRLGKERAAIQATSLLFDLEFFGGVRRESRGLAGALRGCASFLEKAARAGEPVKGVGPGQVALGQRLRRLVGGGAA